MSPFGRSRAIPPREKSPTFVKAPPMTILPSLCTAIQLTTSFAPPGKKGVERFGEKSTSRNPWESNRPIRSVKGSVSGVNIRKQQLRVRRSREIGTVRLPLKHQIRAIGGANGEEGILARG